MFKNKFLNALCCMPVMFNTMHTGMVSNITQPEQPFIIELNNIKSRMMNDSVLNYTNFKDVIDQQVEFYHQKLEEERIAKEIEDARLAELARIAEEERLEQERLEQERIEQNRIYCTFEVSFYTPDADENGGYAGMTASGEPLQPWVSIALPNDIPFYSSVVIDGVGTFVNHDTGGYIQWVDGVCRVDVCVSTKEEAYALGRFTTTGYIDLYQN